MKKRLRKRFDLALEETEITGHVLYDARHSYASTILARCRDFVYVSAQLGHASPKTTKDHLRTPNCRASIRTMPVCSTNPKRIGSRSTKGDIQIQSILFDFLEPPAGFEPATC